MHRAPCASSGVKSCILSHCNDPKIVTVSVLDLEQYRLEAEQARSFRSAHTRVTNDTDVVSLYTMSIHPSQDDQMHSQMLLMIM